MTSKYDRPTVQTLRGHQIIESMGPAQGYAAGGTARGSFGATGKGSGSARLDGLSVD